MRNTYVGRFIVTNNNMTHQHTLYMCHIVIGNFTVGVTRDITMIFLSSFLTILYLYKKKDKNKYYFTSMQESIIKYYQKLHLRKKARTRKRGRALISFENARQVRLDDKYAFNISNPLPIVCQNCTSKVQDFSLY